MKKRSLLLLVTFALILSLFAGCTKTPDEPEAPAGTPGMADGDFIGEGEGYGGPIQVKLTVKDGAIEAVEVLSHSETPDIGTKAVEALPAKIVEAQGTEVEVVAGATVSSQGILAAVADAISQADGTKETVVADLIENPDVIVVGGGMAGLRAALEAADKGAKVQLFEKTGKLGGAVGGSTLSGANTKIQQDAGITTDTAEKFFDDFVRLNEGYKQRNPDVSYSWNEDLGRYYAEHSGQVIDWMDANGFDMGDRTPSQPTLYEPLSEMRVYVGKRVTYHERLIDMLQPHVDSGLVNIALNTKVDELVLDGDAVVGVLLADGREIKAKSTILATGGYGYSEELVKQYNGFESFTSMAAAHATGDGFVMAEKAGAYLRNMDYISAYAGGLKAPEDGLATRLSIRVKDFPYIIFVNADGERFVDELGNEDGSSYDAITQWWKKGKVYIVLDQGMVDALKADGMTLITRDADWTQFEDQLQKGNVIFSGSTPEEVAAKVGVDGTKLAATIDRYNGFAAAGKDDDFGRTRLMKEFTGGTYYIAETTPYIMMTFGGPDMNDKAEVLREDGTVIAGLYQAGEIVGTGNAFGRTTIGGTGNTGALVWGELAGSSAAAYALG